MTPELRDAYEAFLDAFRKFEKEIGCALYDESTTKEGMDYLIHEVSDITDGVNHILGNANTEPLERF
jgi:hypothetical protein